MQLAPNIPKEKVLTTARNVLTLEATSLNQGAEKLSDSFVAAVSTIASRPGKVVVTGLGKSGHIANKIAATLASTGVSAFFLHPSEALHGDMGMLQSNDTLIALAFGGETFEVNEVARYARRLGIPIVAITGNTASQLAKLSDFVLDGSVDKEACPLGLAPTTSSTLALALGDALAVCLMEVKNISTTEFARWHPGGNLGKKLLTVREVMIPLKNLKPVGLKANFYEVIEAVTSGNLGIAPVVGIEDNVLLGCITDGDLRRAFLKYKENTITKLSEDLMSRSPKSLAADCLVLDAFNLMDLNKITAIFVTHPTNNALVGLLKMHDILAAKIV